jgi:tetratricopeptide (TPR) repeat protein
LPRDSASFTGRQVELRRLVEAAAAGGVVDIYAIDGMAGVGKTAFAVHVAHRLADQFADGQIFLPLHGHTPGREPVDPAHALASLLLTVGVSAGQVPSGLDARAALWRDRLAGLQVLLILDDAVGSEQVLPLLPGTGGSLVLATSRRRLSALEDATTVSLDTLPADEAVALFIRLAGRPSLSANDQGVAAIVRLCGYLPLAIGMVARQLRHHPRWTVAGRAAELASAVDRLGLLVTENLSVAAAFDVSYADLDPDQQRLFRRLALNPGDEVDICAAAALDGRSPAEARRVLVTLYDQNLLTEVAPGRYRMHDLVREHARAVAERVDSSDDRERAVVSLLDYYQHTAARAEALIALQTRPGSVAAPEAMDICVLDDRERALAWVRTERAGLLACLDHAAGAGLLDRVVALTAGVAELLRLDGPLDEAAVRHQAAIDAARALGDRLGEANAVYDLGMVRRMAAESRGFTQAMDQALAIYRDLGERLGEANVLSQLGYARRLVGEYPETIAALEAAVRIYRDLGESRGQADALGNLAIAQHLTGEHAASTHSFEAALNAYRTAGDRRGEANVLYYLGVGVQRPAGQYASAIETLELALDIYRELGLRGGEANTQYGLGSVRRMTADYQAATEALASATSIYRELGGGTNLAIALIETGKLYADTGSLPRAEDCYREALELARKVANSFVEADALAAMGRCAVAAGDVPRGVDLLRRALEIYRRIGVPEAEAVASELMSLTEHDRTSTTPDAVCAPAEHASMP